MAGGLVNVFEDLPPPPAPGVDPVTGIARRTVAGGYGPGGRTKHLAPTGDGSYQEGDGQGNWIGPKYPANFPAHQPPPGLLGAGYVCRPDGQGGILCDASDRPLAGDPYTVGATDQPPGFGSAPAPSTPIYGNTENAFDDLQRQNADLNQQLAVVQAGQSDRTLGDYESAAAYQDQAAADGSIGPVPAQQEALPPSAVVVIGVGLALVVFLWWGLG